MECRSVRTYKCVECRSAKTQNCMGHRGGGTAWMVSLDRETVREREL